MTTEAKKKNEAGFSISELILTITIMLIVMGLVSTLFSRSLSTRTRESSKTDAQTAAQAALNVLSREIANSGYGLVGNGLVLADSSGQKLHFFANVTNSNDVLTDRGENVTYFWEPSTQSILRHDANAGGAGVPETSIIINRISNVQFEYFDYTGSNPIPTGPNATPTANTGRVRITLTVVLERVIDQVNPYSVVLTSDVTLRNADYMLRNY
jgi:type II secretory pathway pseudopilin PulG